MADPASDGFLRRGPCAALHSLVGHRRISHRLIYYRLCSLVLWDENEPGRISAFVGSS
jgi:hypothetical protein